MMLNSTHERKLAEATKELRDQISCLEESNCALIESADALSAKNTSLRAVISDLEKIAFKFADQRIKAQSALTTITAMETPNCAHIGKRMAMTARAALSGGSEG